MPVPMFRSVSLCAALCVAVIAGPALAQVGPGLSLGVTGEVDARVHGAPEDLAGIAHVAVRTQAGIDVALLSLRGDPADLRLTGTLPDLRGSHLLQPVTSEELWPCPLESSAEVGFLPLAFWVVGANAVLDLADGPQPPQPEPGYVTYLPVFVDGEARLTGACFVEPQPLDGTLELEVDLDLRLGWNLVASETAGAAGAFRILLRASTEDELAGAAWYWRELVGPEVREVVPQQRP